MAQVHQSEWIHPEILQGEVFVSNMDSARFSAFTWLSKRKGSLAYDGEGHLLTARDWFPVFVQESELRDRNLTLTELRRRLRAVQSRAA